MSANGYLLPSELFGIGDGMSLRNDAGASWIAMRAVALSDRVNIQSPGLASDYRPWAMQLDMRANPSRYGINPNLNGLPGLPSRHGLGTCKDVFFGEANNWMIANGNKYGWTRPAYATAMGDLNHWEFTPGTATASIDSSLITATPPEKDSDMPKNFNSGGTIFTLGENFGTIWTSTSSFSYGANMAAWGAPVAVSLTTDQITTIVGEANARGVARGAVISASTPIDYASLAKAVNDDAARRLAS